MTIVINVGIASHPVSAAGNTWYSLNWALGFRELGWNVWLVESVKSDACVDGHWERAPFEESTNLAYWREITGRFALPATLFVDGQPQDEAVRDFAAQADVFLNLSGHFPAGLLEFPRAVKVYLDADPAFTQIWAEQYHVDMHFGSHDRFLTAGLRLGQPGTFAPTCGIEWLPTFPPVVLKHWPFTPQDSFDRFTSVAHWQGYGSVEWNGAWFHSRREELLKFTDVPSQVSRPIELATQLAAHEADLGPFRDGGWRFVEAGDICASLDRYGEYLRGSSAEFMIAKGGYVTSRAGWFSDRAVCYAASGKPLVLQDTGVGDLLPAGEGFHPFRTPEDAVAACERVIADYPAQQRAARRLAEEYFDSAKVIRRVLDRL